MDGRDEYEEGSADDDWQRHLDAKHSRGGLGRSDRPSYQRPDLRTRITSAARELRPTRHVVSGDSDTSVDPSRALDILGRLLHVPLLDSSAAALSRIAATNRTLMREQRSSASTTDWIGPHLEAWSSTDEPSLLIVQGPYARRFEMRTVLADVVETIQRRNIPILWAFRPIARGDEEAEEPEPRSLTVIDVLKSLVLQAFQLPQVTTTESRLLSFAASIRDARTETDWFRLLSLSLSRMALVYIVIDNETSTPIQDSLLDPPRAKLWPMVLTNILEDQRLRGAATIVKVILAGYKHRLHKSDWRGTPVESAASWASPPSLPESAQNRGRRQPRSAGGPRTVSSFVRPPITASAVEPGHKGTTDTGEMRSNSTGSIDEFTNNMASPHPPTPRLNLAPDSGSETRARFQASRARAARMYEVAEEEEEDQEGKGEAEGEKEEKEEEGGGSIRAVRPRSPPSTPESWARKSPSRGRLLDPAGNVSDSRLKSSHHTPTDSKTNHSSPRLKPTSPRGRAVRLYDEREDDPTSGSDTRIQNELSKEFFSLFDEFDEIHLKEVPVTNRVKIAILDTGIDERQVGFSSRRSLIRDDREKEDPNTNGDPVKAIKSFVQGRTATDVNGHGTHIADILLRIAPRADLFIAKISHGLSVETTDQIADAIDWAVGQGCNIINMSFGLTDASTTAESFGRIDEAIRAADLSRRLLFAAASNVGGNGPRTYPASSSRVICVHAVDGRGNDTGGMNPPVDGWPDRFATLGLGIQCSWNKKVVYKSGTSFAAPVAAGIAANVLDYAAYSVEQGKLSLQKAKNLREGDGMKKLFTQLLSIKRQGYRYVAPWHLWKNELDDEYVWGRLRRDFNL